MLRVDISIRILMHFQVNSVKYESYMNTDRIKLAECDRDVLLEAQSSKSQRLKPNAISLTAYTCNPYPFVK